MSGKSKKRMTKKQIVRRIQNMAGVIFLILFVVFSVCLVTNLAVILSEKNQIVDAESADAVAAQCILILGAGVWNGDTPSPMLADRLDVGVHLYEMGAAPKILVSGDHGRLDYDEVNVMREYLLNRGVPKEDIFMDHAGFSTYESVYRAKEIFGVEQIIIVTQKYHLYRALYIADHMDMTSCGVSADPRTYRGAFMRNAREMVARSKDVLSCILKVQPTYLGERIDIKGDGTVTLDH